MCTTCGCGLSSGDDVEEPGLGHHHDHDPSHDHDHGHSHDHGPQHDHDHGHSHDHAADHGPESAAARRRLIQVEQDVLGRNNGIAALNRQDFAHRGIVALNFVSSPGSGKTTLLCRTIEALKTDAPITVIEGDQRTSNDAERIRSTGIPAYQVNTGKACHLDAAMVRHAIDHLGPAQRSFLFIENVGNLVCPAEFDLGEEARIVILSVTEGDDKPLKYAPIFAASDVLILNKIDLAPYVDFDIPRCIAHAREVRPDIEVFELSARTGEGMEAWIAWLRARGVRADWTGSPVA